MVNIYFDMDGVLAKWNQDASEEETHVAGYFDAREADEKVISLAKKFLEMGDPDVTVTAYSAVYTDDHSGKEKHGWLDRVGLSSINRLFIPYGEDKSRYIKNNPNDINILIDDYGKNLRAWAKAGYVAIKYYNGINDLPKLSVKGDVINISLDTWDGYSINNRMSVDTMFDVVYSLIKLHSASVA